MTPLTRLLWITVSSFALASSAGAVIHVPGDAPTIQAGIDLAVAPETVLVAPGVYNEHIQLKTGVAVFGDDPATTIIDGGGVAIDVVQAINVTGVTFRGFTVTGAISGGSLPGGAGVFVNVPHSSIRIENVIAERNNFGVAVFNAFGRTGPDVIACAVHGNTFYGLSNPGNGLVSGCVIYENGVSGIDISGNSASAQIIGNTIWGNAGHGVNYWNDRPATFRNNIFAANGGYGVHERAPGSFVDPIVEFNLFWDNGLGNYFDVQTGLVRNTEPEINGMPNAEFNLVADPMFCNAPDDFELCGGSPAEGSGFGGADIGAFGVGCICDVDVDDPLLSSGGSTVLGSAPNPFSTSGSTSLSFELAAPARVLLSVHDASGRLVRTLIDGEVPAGKHGVDWDGQSEEGERLPAGTYLLDLRANGRQCARKVTILPGN